METVQLRHPHTGETRTVEAKPEILIPLMGAGFVQYRPEASPMAQPEREEEHQ